MKKTQKTRYYDNYNCDFTETADQNYVLPSDYEWIKTGGISKILSALIYGAVFLIGGIYCKAVLRLTVKNKKALKNVKGGYFIYGNHTQPFGDVVIPALAAFPKRIYTICSPANLGLKGIGPLLPYLGALPVPDGIKGLKKLYEAVEHRIDSNNPVVIYPEAHVWEYYTDIRPFDSTSFTFAVKNNAPVFSMTAVYTKQRFFNRPKTTVYIDGPFFSPAGVTKREAAEELRSAVYNTMKKRCTESNCEYVKYIKK